MRRIHIKSENGSGTPELYNAPAIDGMTRQSIYPRHHVVRTSRMQGYADESPTR